MQLGLFFLQKRTVWAPILIAALLLGGWLFLGGRGGAGFQTIVLRPASFVEQVAVSGNVVAAHEVDLGFAQSGRVSGVYAAVGDHASTGTLLAQTDNGDLRAALAQKQAALDAAQAKLDSLIAGTRPEQIAITASSIASDQVALRNAKIAVMNAIQTAYTRSDDAVHNIVDQFFDSPRSQSPRLSFYTSDQKAKNSVESDRLLAEGIIASWRSNILTLLPDADLGEAEQSAKRNLNSISALLSDANVALNAAITTNISQSTLAGYIKDVAAARANIDAASTALTGAITAEAIAIAALNYDQHNLALQEAGTTQADIAAQQAQVAAARADMQNAQAQLSKTLITAPFTGTVTKMDAKVGEVISPTAPQISMISDGLFQIECYIPEVEIAGLSVGNRATTTLDAFGSSVPFSARVVAIDPAETVKNGVSTYKTTLQFNTPDPRIRSGMTASVIITSQEVPNALVVPQGAVFQNGAQKFVQLLRSGKQVDVAVGLGSASSLGNVQVLSGLSTGDVVILDPDTSR